MADDTATIRAVLADRYAALCAGDAAAAVATTVTGAVTYDLSPPLAYTHEPDAAVTGLSAWFATWDGPISLTFDAPTILASSDLAVAYGFTRLYGLPKSGGIHESWFRTTITLERRPEGWRIVHEHSSYPTRMDGSGLSAIDLTPAQGA
jgi:ketosteroid isomerase-like protein